MMKRLKYIITGLAMAGMLTALYACSNKEYYEMKPPTQARYTPLPAGLPDLGDIHTHKAPLYWSTYEFMKMSEWAGKEHDDCVFTIDQWIEVLDWVKDNLLPYGYDMVCTDGSGTFRALDGSPYMTHQTSVAFKDLVREAHARGLRVGIYDNPMWIHCDDDVLIPGTDIPVGSLRYNPETDYAETTKPDRPGPSDEPMAVITHQGGKEWIDGFFRYYHELGVDMIRMDFLSEYEEGWSRTDRLFYGPGFGRVNYAWFLAYCAEAARKYDIFLSLVMTNMYNDAELEGRYGHMARVVDDTYTGGWYFTSSCWQGSVWDNWPHCKNQFDGFTYWSGTMNRSNLIPDGDFTRLNTYETDAEKEFTISIQLLAGGPIAVSDQPSTIGDNLHFYTNEEMLALNRDRFRGRPLDSRVNSTGSNIWYGTMSNGDHIVGFFNREDEPQSFDLVLSQLGFDGEFKVRDLWRHEDEGTASELHPVVPAHGCKIVKLTK